METRPFSLIIQGGGTRASFCLGAIEGFLADGLQAEYVIGTSAGALIGMMYLINAPKKIEEAFLDYMGNHQFVGLSNVIRKGGLFNFSFFYDDLSKNHKEISLEDFFKHPAEYYAVATDCLNGQPKYFSKSDPQILRGIEASCALPLFSRPVMIDDRPYLDGGTVDSIPFSKPLEEGKEKIVIVSSRPKGFRKQTQPGRVPKMVAKARYGKYPAWSHAFLHSIETYNSQVEEMLKLEEEGRVFVLYPPKPVEIGVAETEREKLEEAIAMGKKAYEENKEALLDYLCR